VGLFGFVRNTTRVFAVTASRTRSSGNEKSGFGATRTGLPPTTSVSKAKISNAGSGTIASAGAPPGAGLRYPTAAAMIPSSSPFRSDNRSGATPRYSAHTLVVAS
jgi:hypothetical protein